MKMVRRKLQKHGGVARVVVLAMSRGDGAVGQLAFSSPMVVTSMTHYAILLDPVMFVARLDDL
jgi:hypothetical protein